MKQLNKILGFLFALITVFLSIYLKDVKVLWFLIYLGVLLILRINSSLKFIALTYVFLGGLLGFTVHLYKITTWYDTFIHFLSGIYIGLISIYILDKFRMFNKKNLLFNIVYITIFVLAVACLWEICEFTIDNIVGSDMQRAATGVNDTMKDIISALIGVVLFNIMFYLGYKNKLGNKFIDNMIGE